MIGRYRKKPVVVEAVQYTGANDDEILSWATRFTTDDPVKRGITGISIATLEGDMKVSPGDWVIKGTRGEFYPCKPEPFADTFEAE